MRTFRSIFAITLSMGIAPIQPSWADHASVDQLKDRIIGLARSYEGQGDPDFSKQRTLEPLVRELLEIAPQPSVSERLPLLHGAWKQIWGPYDYRNDDRGVDPELGIEEIYQVVFEGGYYYNVSYHYKNGNPHKKRINLLRGKYRLDEENPALLKVKFTNLIGTKQKADGRALWELAELAEADELPGKFTIVPSWLVKIFFGGGALREVYTDSDLRILFGSNGKQFEREYIYIMEKVGR